MNYDPRIVSYEELLEVFWQNHNPHSSPWSRQYMSAIFYHDEEQKKLAIESLRRQQAMKGMRVYTEILPAGRFYRAEDYHQKYYLRQRKGVAGMLRGIFPSEDCFVDSTEAARLNGYFAGAIPFVDIEAEMNGSGLPTEDKRRILDALRESAR